MLVPLKIAFHGVDHSDAVEENIRVHVAKLDTVNGRITSCRVTVESRNHEAETRRAIPRIRIDLKVPGAEMVVDEEAREGEPTDINGAVRRAFATMSRKLKKHAERKHG